MVYRQQKVLQFINNNNNNNKIIFKIKMIVILQAVEIIIVL